MTTSTWDNVFTNKAEHAYMYTALYFSVPCKVDMVLYTDYCRAKQFYVGLRITWKYKNEGNVAYG